MTKNFFFRTIQHLRKEEQVLLYASLPQFEPSECDEVIFFLEKEYQLESRDYPFTPPSFDQAAALWAAQYVYITAQLILYRETPAELLQEQLPKYEGQLSPEAVLSADLCLRFLPVLMEQLTMIEPEDALIPLLQETLENWHYSAAAFGCVDELANTTLYTSNPCLFQLYCDRIIQSTSDVLKNHPAFQARINSCLGQQYQQTSIS